MESSRVARGTGAGAARTTPREAGRRAMRSTWVLRNIVPGLRVLSLVVLAVVDSSSYDLSNVYESRDTDVSRSNQCRVVQRSVQHETPLRV